MKITNISTSSIFLRDLRFTAQAQNEGRRGEDQYLAAGASVYLPNTSQVLRSVVSGDIFKWKAAGVISIEDTVDLEALGGADTVVLTHNFGYPQIVSALKQVGITWVDATGTFDAVQNAAFTTVTFTNTTAFPLTFIIRLV